jgi:hypothetical protein
MAGASLYGDVRLGETADNTTGHVDSGSPYAGTIQSGESVMPTATYEDLLVETAPARISDERQYDVVRARFGDLLGRAKRTRAEDKLMDLLGVLIMDYDRRNSMPPATVRPRKYFGSSWSTPKRRHPIWCPSLASGATLMKLSTEGGRSAPSRPASSANCSASVRACLFEALLQALCLGSVKK